MPRQMRSVLLPCDLQASMRAANQISCRDSFNDSYRYGGFASGRTSCSNSISDVEEPYLDHWLLAGFSPPFTGDAGAYAAFCGPESDYKGTGIYGFQTPVSPASAIGDDAISFGPFTNYSLESTRFTPADLQYLSKPTGSGLLQGSSNPRINNFAKEEQVPSQCAAHKSTPNGSIDFPVTRIHANNPQPIPYSALAWQSPSVSYRHVDPAALWLREASEGADARSSSSVDSALLQFQEHEDVLVLNSFPSNLGMHLKTSKVLYPNGPYGVEAKDIEFPARSSLYKTELCRSWEETGYCRYSTKCQICRSYTETGLCSYGKRCRFIHKSESSSTTASPISADQQNVVHNMHRRLPIFQLICAASGTDTDL